MPGFNWASTSRSRKLVTLGYPADALVRLQLGLDLAVEETRHHQGQVRRGEEASIGPRPRGRGNLLALSGLAAGPCRLQLGLDLAVEETKRHDAEQHAGCPASIGPRPRGRGNATIFALPTLAVGAASIGPRPRGRGNATAWRSSSGASPSFNWASTSRSRKLAALAPEWTRC